MKRRTGAGRNKKATAAAVSEALLTRTVRVNAIGVVLAVLLVLFFQRSFPRAAVDSAVLSAALILGFGTAWSIEFVRRILLSRTKKK